MKNQINATAANRKALRAHAKEAMADYSRVMTWLVLDNDGDLYEVVEPQGQSYLNTSDTIVASTGDFYKAHGNGAATNSHGDKYRTQRDYLTDLLGAEDYKRIFEK